MSDQKYMLHSTEYCFGNISYQKFIRDILGGTMVIMSESVKQYKKSKNQWREQLKALKKQNKMLYILANNSGSRREIEKIKAKASKKRRNDSSDSSSNKS